MTTIFGERTSTLDSAAILATPAHPVKKKAQFEKKPG
jgi:hypothetical protein